ncbi:MAG: hypothetical protein NT154_31740 [Verrucomicrobia bacterium]|nr:hypothetical protein [Verrucomicrobiota bacterium]
MKFSFPAFLVTAATVVVSAIASLMEGTFTSKKVTMGFVNHGGMWSDLAIMSMVAGLCFPHFLRNKYLGVLSLCVACITTVIAHVKWAEGFKADGITGHMFPTHHTGVWYRDMSLAGWSHVGVMVLLLAGVIMYAASPTPPGVVVIVSLLLTVHIFIGCVQPGWYCTRKFWTWMNFTPPLCAAGLIWMIALVKIHLARGRI